MITCNYSCSGNQFPDDYNYSYISESLAELILEKCNGSWGKPSDCNYNLEFQEEFILQKLHLQLHFFNPSGIYPPVPNISTLAVLIRPGKSSQNARRHPQNEFLGSAFFLALLFYLIGNPEFSGIFRHFPGEGFWGPRIAFSREDGVDMLGSGEEFNL